MAVASKIKGEHIGPDRRRHVAVIGDGAMSGGMAFEALSNLGAMKKPVLVILNDNAMSISKNVGALSTYLSRLMSGGAYNRAKGDIKSFLEATLDALLPKPNGPEARLVEAMRISLADPAVIKRLQDTGVDPTPDSSSEKLAAFVKDELAKWAPIVKASGAQLD